MVQYSGMIHVADIERSGHAIVARKKVTSQSTVASDIECRIQSVSDTPALSVLGRTAIELFKGFFPPGTDILVGDHVVWKDRTPNVTFLVTGVGEQSSGGYSAEDHHLEADLQKVKAGGS